MTEYKEKKTAEQIKSLVKLTLESDPSATIELSNLESSDYVNLKEVYSKLGTYDVRSIINVPISAGNGFTYTLHIRRKG